jgi:hypothetical protein
MSMSPKVVGVGENLLVCLSTSQTPLMHLTPSEMGLEKIWIESM